MITLKILFSLSPTDDSTVRTQPYKHFHVITKEGECFRRIIQRFGARNRKDTAISPVHRRSIIKLRSLSRIFKYICVYISSEASV